MTGTRATLRELADQCRALARGASMPEVAASLREMADAYEREAEVAEARQAAPPAAPPDRAGEG